MCIVNNSPPLWFCFVYYQSQWLDGKQRVAKSHSADIPQNNSKLKQKQGPSSAGRGVGRVDSVDAKKGGRGGGGGCQVEENGKKIKTKPKAPLARQESLSDLVRVNASCCSSDSLIIDAAVASLFSS